MSAKDHLRQQTDVRTSPAATNLQRFTYVEAVAGLTTTASTIATCVMRCRPIGELQPARLGYELLQTNKPWHWYKVNSLTGPDLTSPGGADAKDQSRRVAQHENRQGGLGPGPAPSATPAITRIDFT
ncbi:hypothetical protein O9K51_01725 [Purpureocillium lavendulum]|uniref:Uncharacterized protein n=1 Tax=Purpureocillium lavendulum TaxID=1247861 RepID=A0AB34G5Q9_9HYPO|nr:hypothetical protein O9K51_01725 [Purpureocillium lavendulum]